MRSIIAGKRIPFLISILLIGLFFFGGCATMTAGPIPANTLWSFTDIITGETERIKLLDENLVYSLDQEQLIGTWTLSGDNTFSMHTLSGDPMAFGVYTNDRITGDAVFEPITDTNTIERCKDINFNSVMAAIFPPYTDVLPTGPNTVKVVNPAGSQPVFVGLYSEGRGKIFFVGASDTNSSNGTADVPHGSYDIYFVYAEEMEDLYKGDSFTLRNNIVEITLQFVQSGNFGIQKVN